MIAIAVATAECHLLHRRQTGQKSTTVVSGIPVALVMHWSPSPIQTLAPEPVFAAAMGSRTKVLAQNLKALHLGWTGGGAGDWFGGAIGVAGLWLVLTRE